MNYHQVIRFYLAYNQIKKNQHFHIFLHDQHLYIFLLIFFLTLYESFFKYLDTIENNKSKLRVPFGSLVELGILKPGTTLFDPKKKINAKYEIISVFSSKDIQKTKKLLIKYAN